MTQTRSDPFSVRLMPDLSERLMHCVAATSGEQSKSDIINYALRTYFKILEVNPSMLEGYDPTLDKSVTHSDV